MADYLWWQDVQRAVTEPHISKIYTGKRRADDRRVIAGACIRWARSVAGRFVWTPMDPNDCVQPLQSLKKRDLWQRIQASVAEAADPPMTA